MKVNVHISITCIKIQVFYGPRDIYSWSYLVTLYEVPMRRRTDWRADGQAGNSDRISMVQSWGGISSLGNLSFVLKAFRWLEEVRPTYQGWTSLLKINWLQMLVHLGNTFTSRANILIIWLTHRIVAYPIWPRKQSIIEDKNVLNTSALNFLPGKFISSTLQIRKVRITGVVIYPIAVRK